MAHQEERGLQVTEAIKAVPDTRNVHQRIHAAMGEVSYIQKDRDVGNYKVVSHDAVTAKVRPVLVKHGVIYYPRDMMHTQNGNRTEVHMDIVFVNVADPKDFIAVPTFGYGIDTSDKGPGKAVSYAVKMALLKTLGLETGLDADDGTDVEHKPDAEPLPDPSKEKNPAGRSKAVTTVREMCREVNACSDASELVALINSVPFKKAAFNTCKNFPKDWLGPEDNSGLSGIVASMGVALKCPDDCTAWIMQMEAAARKQLAQAAE